MNNEMFKICTVGCGSMSTKGHGPSHKKYASLETNKKVVELAACCDLNKEAAAKYAERFGYSRYYTDMDLMLEKEDPSVVCLIVPESIVKSLACKILRKGFPVIMEKPPGLSLEEACEIQKASKESNKSTRVAFNRRYMPLIRRLKLELNSFGDSSKIQNIRYDFYRYNRKESDFYTTAIHGIDVVRHLAGCDYKSIEFHYQDLKGEGDNVINIFMDCIMETGATAQLNFCPVSGAVIERATVHLKDNLFMLSLPVWGGFDTPGAILHFEKNKLKCELSGSDISDGDELFETNGFYYENLEFFDSIRQCDKAGSVGGSIDTALQTAEIAEYVKLKVPKYDKKQG